MLDRFLDFLVSAMNMTQKNWERHANPWSVWTRVATFPFLLLALWSIHWIGWWSLAPIGIIAIWLWLNPRVFPPPASTKSWAARAVMGERIYIMRVIRPIPVYHSNAAQILSIGSAVGALLIGAGLIAADVTAFLLGGVTAFLCKMWFVDRMVWLFDDMAREHPEYEKWLR